MNFSKKALYVALLASLFLPLPAFATMDSVTKSELFKPESTFSGIISTRGVGVELYNRFNKNFAARLSIAGLEFSHNITIKNTPYSGKALLGTALVGVDYIPFEDKGYYITAGLAANANRIQLRTTPAGAVTIKMHTYTASEIGTVSGTAEFNPIAPYLGAGYRVKPSAKSNFYMSAEVGAFYQGKPKIKSLKATGSMGSDPTLLADLEKRKMAVEDYLEVLQVMPVATLTAGYRF